MSKSQTYIFYIALIFISYILILLSERVQFGNIRIIKKNNDIKINLSANIFRALAFMILLIPLVKRKCGADTPVYYFDYTYDRIYSFDRTFSYILKGLHKFIPDPQIGLGLVSTISLGLVFIAFIMVKDIVDIRLSFFAYFTLLYFYLYNYMRIMLAVSIIMIGYSLVIQGKRKVAIIPFAFASLIHLSSIIIILIYITVLNFGKYKRVIIASSIIILFVFLMSPASFLSLITTERYREQINYASLGMMSIGFGTLIRALPILYLLWIYGHKYKGNIIYNYIIIFAIANVVFSFIGYYVGVASRISNMYLVYHLVYGVPFIVKDETNNRRRQIVSWFFVLYCFVMYYMISKNFETMNIVPYF